MTKNELIARMAEEAGISKKAAEAAMKSMLDGIQQSLEAGEKVTFVGFGTFSVAERKERESFNPQTKEKMHVPAKKVPKFKAGSKLRAAVE